MASITIPTKIEDHIIEEAAEQYRKICGTNDVLMHKNKVIPFDYYLSLHLAKIEVDRTVMHHEARRAL